jgi:acyl carrier protein
MDLRRSAKRLIEGLEAGAVARRAGRDFRGPFLDGTLDATFAELELDSLARMELCIAIEVALGVSLAPEELERYPTLDALVADIEERLRG